MKTLKDIENILGDNKSLLEEKFKVKRIGIFGSYTRNEESKTSDVDILVELYEPIGWDFVELKLFLEDLLGLKVDLVTTNAIKPVMRSDILQEVIYA